MVETIQEPKKVKAIKEHICCFCGGEIKKGERYEYGVFKYDEIYAWKNHIHCGILVSWLDMEDRCDEGVSEQSFHESIEEEYRHLFDGPWIPIREMCEKIYYKDFCK